MHKIRILNYPDFFVIGAGKSGTTSLYSYFKEHPQVFVPEVKEPYFFTFKNNKQKIQPDLLPEKYMWKSKNYLKLYKNAGSLLKGDFSTSYLHAYKDTIKNIKKSYSINKIKELKFVTILRNPIDRTLSHYKSAYYTGLEKRSLPMLIKDLKESNAKQKIKKDELTCFLTKHYFRTSLYYSQVKAYLENFPKKNLKIIFFEQFIRNKNKTLKEICHFLGIKYRKVKGELRHNVTETPRNKFIYFLIRNKCLRKIGQNFSEREVGKQLKSLFYLKKNDFKVDNKSKLFLKNYFRNDIEKLSRLLKTDLQKKWLN